MIRQLFDNPILLREIRRRMRNKGLIYMMIAYIAVLSMISFIIILTSRAYFVNKSYSNYFAFGSFFEAMQRTGFSIYYSVTIIQALFILLVAPIITAGAITTEKEEQTFDFLRVTTISPANYIFGCLASNFLYICLMLICALPVLGLCFLFGGVGPDDIVSSFFLLLSIAFLLSVLGIMISSINTRTRSAQNSMIGFIAAAIAVYIFGGINIFTRIFFENNFVNPAEASSSFFTLIYFFNFHVPLFIFWFSLFIILGVVFFIIAKRKLFYPENRELSYIQYIGLCFIINVFFTGFIIMSLSPPKFFFMFYVNFVLFLSGAVIFGRQIVETGNELWTLKKKTRFFRGFDESILVMGSLMILMSIFFWLIGKIIGTSISNFGNPFVFSLMLTSQIFILMVWVKHKQLQSASMKKVKTIAILFIVFFWVILPAISGIIFAFFDSLPLILRSIPVFFMNISPVSTFILKAYLHDPYSRIKILNSICNYCDIVALSILIVLVIVVTKSYIRKYKAENKTLGMYND